MQIEQQKTIQNIANEVMTTHIDYEILTHKMKNPTQPKEIPPVDIQKLEKFVDNTPRYRLPTTSRMLKEMNIDEREIIKFKKKYWNQNPRRGKQDKNQPKPHNEAKADLIEFVSQAKMKKEMKEYESEVQRRMMMIETQDQDPLQDYKLSLMEMRVDRDGRPLTQGAPKKREPVLKSGTADQEMHDLFEFRAKKHEEKM